MSKALGAMVVVAAFVPVGAEVEKYHHTILDEPGGDRVLAEFTTIQTMLDDGEPLRQRILYQDDRGRRLVIRDDYTDPVGSEVCSVECPSTGELIEFAKAGTEDALIVRFDGESLVILRDEIDTNAPGLPDSVLVRADAMFADLTPSCRSTLAGLAEMGTAYSTLLHFPAFYLTAVLFPEMSGTVPDVDTTSDRLDPVRPFDPSRTPPNAFERQFGEAYFE